MTFGGNILDFNLIFALHQYAYIKNVHEHTISLLVYSCLYVSLIVQDIPT